MNQFKSVFRQTKYQLLVIVILTIGVYANSLGNKLVWDDHLFLESWPQITSPQHLGEIFKGSAPPAQDKVYRPVRGLIYVIDWQLWGANPVFYHIQALLLHLAVTVLVYFIAREILLNAKRLTTNAGNENHALSIKRSALSNLPFITALLFGLHPIHTETIAYISASMETWGSLFFFASFAAYLYANSERMSKRMYANERMMLRIASVGLAVLAFFTYELTLTLPILLILADLVLIKPIKTDLTESVKSALFRYVPYFAAAAVYLLVRTNLLGLISRTDYLAYSFYLTMLVMVKVVVRYIMLLIAPFNQTAIHNLVGDFPSSMIPYDKLDPVLNQTLFDLDVLLAITVIVALVLIAIKCIKAYPIVTFGIGWFFVTLLPVSYIIPHGGAMAEKYLYIASFGVILAAVAAIAQISPAPLKLRGVNADFVKQALVYIGVVVLLFYGISTVVRNRVWQNDITLFSDVVKKSPGNLLANYTLGFWYGKTGNFEAAKGRYLTAIEKAPEFWEARFNLANIYVRQGKFEAAQQEYENVLKIYPKNIAAKNILSNMALLKESSQSAQPSDELLASYKTKDGLKFNFPASWSIKEEKGALTLEDADSLLTVEIGEERKLASQTFDDYIKAQKDSYGTLVNQGLAQIPNVQEAYVRVWSKQIKPIKADLTDSTKSAQISNNQRESVEGNEIAMQFFLIQGDQVIQVLAYPADSPNMATFDGILGSIKIE